MSYKDLIIFDGRQLSGADTSIPEDLRDGNMSAEQFFELANSRVTECLYGFELPYMVTYGFEDIYYFSQLLEEDPQRLLQEYYNQFIAVRLHADPIVVSILDGSTIRSYLENEDDFVNLAENLFTDVDVNQEGEIDTSQMRTALLYFGPKIGVPSFSDLPIVDDILKKHGVEEGEVLPPSHNLSNILTQKLSQILVNCCKVRGKEVVKVEQAQFARLLKLVLQDIADSLALNKVTVQREDIKVANGGLPRQFLEDENFVRIFTAVLYQQTSDDSEADRSFEDVMKKFIEKNAAQLGIHPFDANDEDVVRLYDAAFSDDDFKKTAIGLEENEVGELGKKFLENFAKELEDKPLLYNI